MGDALLTTLGAVVAVAILASLIDSDRAVESGTAYLTVTCDRVFA